ncbi:MAG: helix-turn-helix domain-containing protein [Candidatus Bathyarchaeia archaeon]
MARKAVKVIRDPEIIKVLADPVRREMLRLIAAQPQTETQLAEKLSLSKPSTGYHLQTLLKAGLIRITSTKVGSHGILEKYYEPTSTLFLEDFDKIPPELQRYFIHGHIERLRGMLSAFQIMGEDQGQAIEITPDQLKELAQEIARRMTSIGENYEETETEIGRENLLIKIYSETLKSIMAEGRWRRFFPGASNLG